jgi:DMSO/TMAO reductase YedYZ molybdopterin-dependent catalytic subunit
VCAGSTPRTPLEEWTFSIQGAVEEARSWTWDEFTALPAEDMTVDIHCVTKWSKLETRWKGARSTRCWTASRPRLTG